jgi:hypothetical protein
LDGDFALAVDVRLWGLSAARSIGATPVKAVAGTNAAMLVTIAASTAAYSQGRLIAALTRATPGKPVQAAAVCRLEQWTAEAVAIAPSGSSARRLDVFLNTKSIAGMAARARPELSVSFQLTSA